MAVRVWLTTALATAALVACPAPPPEPVEPPPVQTTWPASPTTPDRPGLVRIALAGDVHFEGVLADRLRDPHTVLAPAAGVLADADLAVVNLETSVGTGGRPEPGKRFTFSAGPEAFTALAAAGIDVVTMANNHALDFGRGRLPHTLEAARDAAEGAPPLDVIGIGRDRDEAFTPSVRDIAGTVVATVAASVADQDPTADRTGHWAAGPDRPGIADALDPARLLAAVRSADRQADVVVAYLHWGVQGQRCPSPAQRTLAIQLVDAGADVVVGTHAHELQGDGRLGAGYVAYGLGNFAWYSPGPTGILTLTVRPARDPSGRARVVRSDWWAARIHGDGLARPLDRNGTADALAQRQALRACAGLRR